MTIHELLNIHLDATGVTDMLKWLKENDDSDYNLWINQLVERYRSCQIRATVKAYEELLRFYWSTGEDIIKEKS